MASRTMILLDPDLDGQSPHGRRPVRGDPESHPAPDNLKGATLHDSPQLERKRRVPSARALGGFLRKAQAAVRLRGMVSVLLTTDSAIRRLNRTFRGKNKATDVLSFPAAQPSLVSKTRPGAPARQQVSGDLAISVETARRQAAEQGHSLAVEVKVLMLHGLLHLAGYDHENDDGKMERRERVLRERLGLPSGLIERSSAIEGNRPSRFPTLATERSRKDGARKLSGLGSSPTLSTKGRRSSLPTLATEKSRKDGARKLSGLGSSPTLSPKSRRKDGAPSVGGKAGGKTGSGRRTAGGRA